MLFRKCSILVVVLLVLPYADSKNIRVTVTGRLLCHGKPLQDASIQLYEKDDGDFAIDSDDLLSEQRPNADGSFNITGTEAEYGGIEPYIKISKVSCTVHCDEQWKMRVDFEDAESDARHDLGDIEMANACAHVYAEDKHMLKLAQFNRWVKEPENYATVYSKLMDLRNKASAGKVIQKSWRHMVGVSGQMTCEGQPIRDLQVQVFIKINTGIRETLDRTHTDANGRFVVLGSTTSNLHETKKAYLLLRNVNCGTQCTGKTKVEFHWSISTDSILTLPTIDVGKACAKLDYRKASSLLNYDVSGQLTCGGKPLSGVHITLYEDNALFSYQQLAEIDTTDKGHFVLRTTTMPVEKDTLHLNITGITCGTKCNGNWHVKVALDDPWTGFSYDLGVMNMKRFCSTHESGLTINYEDQFPA